MKLMMKICENSGKLIANAGWCNFFMPKYKNFHIVNAQGQNFVGIEQRKKCIKL